MKYYPFLFLLIASLAFTACDEDSFSQIVDIELPEHESKPVLNMQVIAGDRTLETLVSLSKGILDTGNFELPKPVLVEFFKNGSPIGDFDFYHDILKYEAYLQDDHIDSTAGNVYRLEATVPHYEKVYAEQVMPIAPLITGASFELEGTISPDGDRVDELIVELDDRQPGILNYYGILAYSAGVDVDPVSGDTISRSRTRIYLESVDPLLGSGSRYDFIFSDESFDGGDYQARMYTYSGVSEDRDVEVEVYSLTRDGFLYYRSLQQYYDAVDNPFAEPVTVHNNIEGGYGIFTLTNVTKRLAD